MEHVRFEVVFEWQGQMLRVTLLAQSLEGVGKWLDRHYKGLTAVRIERRP